MLVYLDICQRLNKHACYIKSPVYEESISIMCYGEVLHNNEAVIFSAML